MQQYPLMVIGAGERVADGSSFRSIVLTKNYLFKSFDELIILPTNIT